MMKKLLFILFAALSFSFAAAVVDINTATAQELTTIKGIGAKTAEKIVAYREANGPFKSVDDLTKVSGIKEKRLDKIRAELTVGGAGAAKAAAAKPAAGKAADKAAAAKEAVKEKAAPAKPAAK